MKLRKQRLPKRIGGRRRAAGWTLLLLGLLVAGVWVASGWWVITITSDQSQLGFGHGHAYVARALLLESKYRKPGWWPEAPDYGRPFDRQDYGLRTEWADSIGWTPLLRRRGFETSFYNLGLLMYGEWDYSKEALPGITREYSVALWPIPLFFWTPAALLLRSGIARRRAIAGKCKSCGYDLAGLPPAADAPCPECGKQKTSHG